MNPERIPERQNPEKRNGSLGAALAFRFLMATTALGVAFGGAVEPKSNGSIPTASAAECVGPDVPCPTPDGIARKGVAEVYRVLLDEKSNAFSINDAAVRVSVMTASGTSDYPKFDLEHPRVDTNGVPVAFQNTKNGEWRYVGKSVVFVSAEPNDPRFTGKLINTETGETNLSLEYGPDEIKDRAVGKSRGESGCKSDDQDCQLNCETTVVFERLIGASNQATFIDSTGKPERDQTAVWMWNGAVKSVHRLVSFTRLASDKIKNLIGLDQAKPTTTPKMTEVRE